MLGYSIIALAAASALPLAAGQAMCYFPDGSPSPTDFVCNSTTGDGFSSCCGHQTDNSQAYCMSNGLCLSDMFLSRGSCTDKTWKSSNCAQVCTTESPGGGVGVRPCGYTNTWDCGNGTGCATSAIKINTGSFILSNAQLNSMGAQRIPSSSSSSAFSSPTTSPSPASSSSSSAATGAVPANLVDQSQVSAVGAGVGVPFGLLAASFLGLWLWERRRHNRLKQQLAFEHAQFGGPADGAAPSSYHRHAGSLATSGATTPMGMKRMASQHSVVLSPLDGRGRQQSFGQNQQQQGGYAHSQRSFSQSGQQSWGQRNYSQGSQQHGYAHTSSPPVGVRRAKSHPGPQEIDHPAYREAGFGGYDQSPPPPPPPKAYASVGEFVAEVPAEVVRGNGNENGSGNGHGQLNGLQLQGRQREYSGAQELPTDI